YAHQDKEDDEAIGLRSTALTLGDATRPVVAVFYAGALVLWAVAGALAGGGGGVFLALGRGGGYVGWAAWGPPAGGAANCLKRFRSNQLVGWILCLALVVDLSSRMRF